jgi:hypothetical protein
MIDVFSKPWSGGQQLSAIVAFGTGIALALSL